MLRRKRSSSMDGKPSDVTNNAAYHELIRQDDDLVGRLALASLVIGYFERPEREVFDLSRLDLSRERLNAIRTAAKSTLDTYTSEAITSYRNRHREELEQSSFAALISNMVEDRIRPLESEIRDLRSFVDSRTHWIAQAILNIGGAFAFGLMLYAARLLPKPW